MRTTLLLAAAFLAACGGGAASDSAAGTSTEVATSADTGATDTDSSTATATGTNAEGAALYATHCASCHGADGLGVSGPALGYNISGKTDEELRTLIREGGQYMPPVAVPDEDIPVLIAYLRAAFTHGR